MGVVVVLYLSSLVESYSRLRSAEDRLESAVKTKNELEAKRQELLLELESVQTEDFKEYLAREKLGLVKEGEYVVILPEEEILQRLSPREIESIELELPKKNWVKWGEVLFDI